MKNHGLSLREQNGVVDLKGGKNEKLRTKWLDGRKIDLIGRRLAWKLKEMKISIE